MVLLYLGLQIVGQGLLGPRLADSGVPIADTAAALWAPARVALLVTACISMAGFLLGNLLGSSRLLFALGRDGYLPQRFGRVSATHRVPLLALLSHAGLAWVLAIGGSFDGLALISGGAICWFICWSRSPRGVRNRPAYASVASRSRSRAER